MSYVLLFRQELQAQIELRRREVIDVSQQHLFERFERVCARADVWQSELQIALVHCRDFHRTIDNLHDWLSRIDDQLKAVEPIDLLASQSELGVKLSCLKVLLLCITTTSFVCWTQERVPNGYQRCCCCCCCSCCYQNFHSLIGGQH